MQQIVSRTRLVYGSLLAVFCLIMVWQTAEHIRVRKAAKATLINRSRDIASTLGLVIRSTRRGPFVSQERLESALKGSIKLIKDAGRGVGSEGWRKMGGVGFFIFILFFTTCTYYFDHGFSPTRFVVEISKGFCVHYLLSQTCY